MLLAVQLATFAVGVASCPSNLANDLAAPAPAASQQLITVEAATTRATYATTRTWVRVDGCWVPTGRGPYTARVGRSGVRKNKREGDGSTPAGTFAIGRTMYGNSPSPGVSYPYVRLHCGDWWVEDSKSPAYNTFQRVGCERKPPFRWRRLTCPDRLAHTRTSQWSSTTCTPSYADAGQESSSTFRSAKRQAVASACDARR